MAASGSSIIGLPFAIHGPLYDNSRREAPLTQWPDDEDRTEMIRHPLGLRLDPGRPVREQIYEAARMGARGVVLDAIGDLAPQRLGETGRRELRHLLRTVELSLIAVGLPTRRPFDTTDQLDERVRRADGAFAMAYELGTSLVLVRVGAVPGEEDEERRAVFTSALASLGHRADHRGVRLAIETGTEPGQRLKGFLDALDLVGLAASVDPASLLRSGIDPVRTVTELADWVAHAYVGGLSGGSAMATSAHPRGFGFAPGVLDLEAYLGALEEIGYSGFLTVWPDPAGDIRGQFTAIATRTRGS
jgi:sugar phosphate isomerase/epimerase